ncbi:hypothetical protein H0H93_010086 [Arthromyces matolae]|nr:hypothetical protein H0H93_010086 [Arthromyces matolae]
MSFASLKKTRDEKRSKSYVQSLPSQPVQSEGQDIKTLDEVLYSLPDNIEIRRSESSGRGLWSKTKYTPGSTLLVAKPHIAVLSNRYLDSYCSNCFGPAPECGLKRCTTCRTVWYCGSVCQSKDWPSHKRECAALQEWAKAAPSPDLAVPSDAIRHSLQASSFEFHTHLSHGLVRYLGISSPEEMSKFQLNSPGDLVDIISRFVTNTFSVTNDTLLPIGASVSPIVALINHSCEPNAVVVFPRSVSASTQEPFMQVIAIRPIEPNEEILTSYIDTTLPRHLRQSSLKETYNFDCQCTLCISTSSTDPRESIYCPKKCGGLCPIPLEDSSLCQCTTCKAVLKDNGAVIDAVHVGQEGLDKAEALQLQGLPANSSQTSMLITYVSRPSKVTSTHNETHPDPYIMRTTTFLSSPPRPFPSPPLSSH